MTSKSSPRLPSYEKVALTSDSAGVSLRITVPRTAIATGATAAGGYRTNGDSAARAAYGPPIAWCNPVRAISAGAAAALHRSFNYDAACTTCPPRPS